MASKLGNLALLALFGLAGCSDNSDDLTGVDFLTEAQAGGLANAIFMQVFEITSEVPDILLAPEQLNAAPQGAPVFKFISATVECDGGGTVTVGASVDGDVDTTTGVYNVDLTVQQDYTACRLSGGQNTFTLNGTPGLTHVGNLSSDVSGNVYASGTISAGTGQIAWSAGGGGGTCAVALQYTGAVVANGTGSFSVSGSICGELYSQELDVTTG
jgi:hypothetical protein